MPSRPRLLLRVLLLILCLGIWPAQARPLPVEPAQAIQVLTVAEFARSADGPWQTVALPDEWQARQVPRPGEGWYRWRLQRPAGVAGDAVLAAAASRLLSQHRLWFNGVLLHDSRGWASTALARPQPWVQQLPPALWHDGDNELLLQVRAELRAGQSVLQIGPADLLEADHERRLRLEVTLPQALNSAAAGACVFALLLWWRRRSEAAMGWFGLLGLLASMRNFAYYEVGTGLLPPVGASLAFLLAQALLVLLLGLFAMALTRRGLPGYRPVLVAGSTLLAVAAVAAAWSGIAALDSLRVLAYPGLVLLSLPALWLVAQRVRHMRGGELAFLLASLALVVVAGVHDYQFQRGLGDLDDSWWLPHATPLMVVAFAVLMIGRVVAAMTQVEELNQTLEQRVRQRTEALAEAHAAKSRFLAAASHDLRQPVVTIGLLVDLLREQLVDPVQRATAAKVDRAVAALESLLGGLLDLSRLESGRVRVLLQPLSLQSVFDAVAVHEREAARAKGLALVVQATALQVVSDAVLLEQIVRNLVSNAVRHTDAGRVLLRARRVGDAVRLQVWDSGRGIARAQRQRVFDDFVQLGNAQRDRSQGLGLGLGLGLGIVQRSAALLGAPLTLRSRPGRGSCFAITLPLHHGARPELPLPLPAERWLAGRHLVVVEDDAEVRDALAQRLTDWGARLTLCDGPRSLREQLERWPPAERQADLVLSDYRLPDGSGLDVVLLARRRFGAGLPVLVMTGNTAPEDLRLLHDSGLPVLHKPFRAEQLRAAIGVLIGD